MPLIIHAAWIDPDHAENEKFVSVTTPETLLNGQLFVWAEDLHSVDNLDSQTRPARHTVRRGSATTSAGSFDKTPSHPFQATVAQLRAWLGEEFSAVGFVQSQPSKVTVWLPSQNGFPTVRRNPSSTTTTRKERTEGAENVKVTLSAWQVTGLALPPLPALQLLGQLGSAPLENNMRNGAWQRIQQGKDLQFWSHAAKLALEILINQQFVPALRPDKAGKICAIWQPVLLDGKLQLRFEQLVAAIPPVCRAYNLTQSSEAPTARQLIEHFVAMMVDAAVQHTTQQEVNNNVFTGSNETPTDQVVSSAADHSMQQFRPSLSGGEQMVMEAWLRSLRGPDRQLHIPPQALYRFYEQWQSWLEQLQTTADALFRACFVLKSPDPFYATDPHAGWSLHYELQACDNLALRIPAHDVWTSTNGALRVGNRRLDRPQDRLLAGLGAARRLFEPIAESLRTQRPERAELTTAQAYQFLREIGPLLESIGFGVIYPTWWNSSERGQLGLRLRMAASRYNFSDLPEPDNDLQRAEEAEERNLHSSSKINYSWELTLGAKPLAQADFERIAGLHTPLLWLDDRWVELDPAQIQAARRFINEGVPSGQLSFLQSLRLLQGVQGENRTSPTSAGSLSPATLTPGLASSGQRQNFYLPSDAPDLLPLQAVDVESWLLDLLQQLRTHQPPQPISEPTGFVGELRPYQQRGVGWLDFMTDIGLGACLADDMGLGKTIQAIALLLHKWQLSRDGNQQPGDRVTERQTPMPALIICPTSVLANWHHEIERFAPSLRVMIHHGNNRLSSVGFAQAVREHDVLITSFGTARRDIEMLQKWLWSHLILDEAQNIKNPGAKQSQAVRAIDAESRIALTGTPVENRLSELWSILDFLNPGYLESFERFRQRYVVPIERYNDEESAAELRRLVQPFFLRRVKSDPTIISDLPDKQETVVYCSLSEEQATLYEKTVRETLDLIDHSTGIQRRGQVLALLTKLKQITNHPAHYLKQEGPLPQRSGKLDRLSEMLEEAVEVGDQALVFTQFVEMGHLLQRHLSETLGVDVLFLHGGTPANQRDRMVQAFQAEDGPPIFVLSLRAGGSGLNLTRANHVFHFDRWWNPAVENQATDRAFRIGQKRNVLVHKFVVAGTLEERIQTLLESKQALADAIVGSGEDWLTEMSTDELREMLTLRHDMVEEL